METLLKVVSCPFLFPYQPSFNSQMPFFKFLVKCYDFKPLNLAKSSFIFKQKKKTKKIGNKKKRLGVSGNLLLPEDNVG